jgi:hypothetical protein
VIEDFAIPEDCTAMYKMPNYRPAAQLLQNVISLFEATAHQFIDRYVAFDCREDERHAKFLLEFSNS